MKACLLYRDRDFEIDDDLPPASRDVITDLDLNVLFEAMAGGDRFLFEVARRALLLGPADPDTILYRQEVLQDCFDRPELLRELYGIAVEAMAGERKIYVGLGMQRPSWILYRSVEVLELFAGLLKRLRRVVDQYTGNVHSEGFTQLFATLSSELDDQYLALIDEHLRRLQLRDGVVASVKLGRGGKGYGHVLRTPKPKEHPWRELLGIGPRQSYTYQVAPRDEAGGRTLSDLRDRAINSVANALAQSTDHILSFFTLLRAELGFYVGCVNLAQQLAAKGSPVCVPVPTPMEPVVFSATDLYDVSLCLRTDAPVVGNEVQATGKPLVLLTGANSGGKSTLLRAMGQAQLMMQCGMFVAARSLRANVCTQVFTHFIRDEDETMTSGRFDAELRRMDAIAESIRPHALMLFNESFSGTNDREGSEIARQIVRALLESGVKVFYVTHLYDLAESFYTNQQDQVLSLRAEREPDGRRSFKLLEREPLPTSFGEDIYRRLGGWSSAA